MKYVLLFLSAILFYFSRGNDPSTIALIISMILLVRYIRINGKAFGYFTALPIFSIALYLDTSKTYIFFDTITSLIISVIGALMLLLPFLLDKILVKKFPAKYSHLFLPVIIVATDFIVLQLSGGDSWGAQAYAFGDQLILMQLFSITGFAGINFLLYWTASVTNLYWESGFEIDKLKTTAIIFTTTILVVFGFGIVRLYFSPTDSTKIQVATITPDADQNTELEELLLPVINGKILDNAELEDVRTAMVNSFEAVLNKTKEQATESGKIICWSEGAVMLFSRDENDYIDSVKTLALENEVFIGMSVLVMKDNFQELMTDGVPFIENKLIFISPEGNVEWTYHKSRLVQGVETGKFIKGDGIILSSDFEFGTITGVICYDMDSPEYISQINDFSPSLLLAPSNDWPEIKNIHSVMAKARAIENGVSMLRPTSNGISTAVDAYGRTIGSLDFFETNGASMSAELPLNKTKTIYSVIGHTFEILCTFAFVSLLFFWIYYSRKTN